SVQSALPNVRYDTPTPLLTTSPSEVIEAPDISPPEDIDDTVGPNDDHSFPDELFKGDTAIDPRAMEYAMRNEENHSFQPTTTEPSAAVALPRTRVDRRLPSSTNMLHSSPVPAASVQRPEVLQRSTSLQELQNRGAELGRPGAQAAVDPADFDILDRDTEPPDDLRAPLKQGAIPELKDAGPTRLTPSHQPSTSEPPPQPVLQLHSRSRPPPPTDETKGPADNAQPSGPQASSAAFVSRAKPTVLLRGKETESLEIKPPSKYRDFIWALIVLTIGIVGFAIGKLFR
ncbi:MAG: hypothetical protein AAFV29_25810, partial [Myxococcota bacterium]